MTGIAAGPGVLIQVDCYALSRYCEETAMKLIVAVTALIAAVALASPAEAASKKHKKGAHRAHAGVHTGMVRTRPASARDPYSVYVSGEYIGSDPDPNIRASMRRNPHNWDGPE
jgi:hypothetical protein